MISDLKKHAHADGMGWDADIGKESVDKAVVGGVAQSATSEAQAWDDICIIADDRNQLVRELEQRHCCGVELEEFVIEGLWKCKVMSRRLGRVPAALRRMSLYYPHEVMSNRSDKDLT